MTTTGFLRLKANRNIIPLFLRLRVTGAEDHLLVAGAVNGDVTC